MNQSYLLSAVLFLPLLGAITILFIPREEEAVCRGIGLWTSIFTFLASLALVFGFDSSKTGYQFVNDKTWISSLGVHYKVGVDGISLWLVILTTFLTPIVLLSSTKSITRKVKEFTLAFLVLETGMIGTFAAIDLFLFYVMWEVMLIPMYVIIGVWGGDRKVYASIKFVIYTMVGSLLMLVAIFYLYVMNKQAGGGYTFDLEAITSNLNLDHTAQMWAFLAFGLAFAIKVPLFPLHTWLPDAHVEAPTAGSVILAGVLLKFGVYGFIRYAIPLFPWAAFNLGPWLIALAVIGIVYGALVAWVQEDVKKLVAYSSVSHLGFCVLGAFALNAQGLEGSIMTMLSHGLTTGGLFLAIGVLYERRHTRKLAEYGGVWAKMPVFGAMFLLVTLGSAGLPGLSGFVGEFLSLVGGYDAGRDVIGMTPYMGNPQAWTIVATSGVILGAVYLLWMFQKVMFGPVTNTKNQSLKDLTARELFVFAPIVAGVFLLGFAPKPFLKTMEPTVQAYESAFREKLADSQRNDTTHLIKGPPAAAAPAAAPGGDKPAAPAGAGAGAVR